jgi:hypothetical protein
MVKSVCLESEPSFETNVTSKGIPYSISRTAPWKGEERRFDFGKHGAKPG